jgi:predicted hydrocarbon binding protein
MMLQETDLRIAFLGLGLQGDDVLGVIERMGTTLLLASAGLMTAGNAALLRTLRDDPDQRAALESGLRDAAQWAAYVTFLDLMGSAEWAALAAPSTRTVMDRLESLCAIINCWGWGKVGALHLDEEQKTLTFEVQHSETAEFWRMHFGPAFHPVCFAWAGVAGALLDVLLGQNCGDFEGREVECAAMRGGVVCQFLAMLQHRFGSEAR